MKTYVPHYVQIKSQLSKEIATLQPHQRIASEHELMLQYGVSRGTVKQAVLDLVYDGLLYRVQGKGTFVAPARINRSFEHLPTFTNDVLAQGFKPVYRMLYFGTVYAGSPVAEKLKVIPGTGVIRYKRVMSVDSEPLAVICSYLRSDVFPDFQMSDIGESLYQSLLKKYNTMPTMAVDTYSIVRATVKTADLLGIRKGDPLFFSERVGQHSDGSPVEYVESFIRGDKYKLTISMGNGSEPNPRQITHHFESQGRGGRESSRLRAG